MNGPFRRIDDHIAVTLSPHERALLRTLPDRLARLGSPADDPAAARLSPAAYRDDPEASAAFTELIEDDLAAARSIDRQLLTATVSADSINDEEAEAWMRVVGDARLTLAAEIGIEDEAWETDRNLADSQEGLMLRYLSYVQDSLIRVLAHAL